MIGWQLALLYHLVIHFRLPRLVLLLPLIFQHASWGNLENTGIYRGLVVSSGVTRAITGPLYGVSWGGG